MRIPRTLHALFAAVIVAVGAASAWAQSLTGSSSDYSCTQATSGSYYETVPSSGVTSWTGTSGSYYVTASMDDGYCTSPSPTLPFDFTYFGTTYTAGTAISIATNGTVVLTTSTFQNL